MFWVIKSLNVDSYSTPPSLHALIKNHPIVHKCTIWLCELLLRGSHRRRSWNGLLTDVLGPLCGSGCLYSRLWTSGFLYAVSARWMKGLVFCLVFWKRTCSGCSSIHCSYNQGKASTMYPAGEDTLSFRNGKLPFSFGCFYQHPHENSSRFIKPSLKAQKAKWQHLNTLRWSSELMSDMTWGSLII